jgi:hypothetical protein
MNHQSTDMIASSTTACKENAQASWPAIALVMTKPSIHPCQFTTNRSQPQTELMYHQPLSVNHLALLVGLGNFSKKREPQGIHPERAS